VSNLDFFEAPGGGTRRTPPPTSAAPARQHRRLALLIAGILVASASLATLLVVVRPHPRDDRPVVLPDTLAGLTAAEPGLQFGQAADLRTQWRDTFGDHPFDARAFGGVRPGPLVNLVVVRTDSRGEADLRLGRPPYTKFGDVSCTRTFQLPDSLVPGQDQPKPFHSDRILLCWRARTTLTVSVLVPTSPAGYEQTAAQAVEEVWALEQ
jgi:hypothetical protein